MSNYDLGDIFHTIEQIKGSLIEIIDDQAYAEIEDIKFNDKIINLINDKIVGYNVPTIDSDIENFLAEVYDVDMSIDLAKYATFFDLCKDIAEHILSEKKAKEEAELAAAKAAEELKKQNVSNNNLGVLLLPSLEEHGRFITIQGITITEADVLVKNFTSEVCKLRKVKNFDATATQDSSSLDKFYNVLDFTCLSKIYHPSILSDFEEAVDELKESHTRGIRGLRPIFVSFNENLIAIGTTVVFNKNWATINYSDPKMFDTLTDIQSIIG